MDGKMNKIEDNDGQLPTINWFLSLPNLLNGECQKEIPAEENKGREKRRRPSSCQHSSDGHLARKRGRICNSAAKANLLSENVSNSTDYGHHQPNTRPPFNNVQLAIHALKNCPQQSGTLNDILAFISTKFEYFRNSVEEKESLKNSIRQILTQNNGKIFKKINSSKNGRNAIWTLASNSNEAQKCEKDFCPKIEEKAPKNCPNEFDHNYSGIMPPNSLSPIINVYKKWELSSEFEGADLRPFIQFISAKCISRTLEIFLFKKIDKNELDKIASASDQSATTSETAKQKSGGNVGIDLNKSKSSSSSSEKGIPPKRLRIDSTDLEDESLLGDWPQKEWGIGSPNKSLQLMPSPDGSFHPLARDSLSPSAGGSGKSQDDVLLLYRSNLDGNLTEEQVFESGEDNGTELPPNPWALLFKRALSKYNEELLANTPSNIQEEPAEQIYNGWAEIFKYVLTKFNPNLLHVE